MRTVATFWTPTFMADRPSAEVTMCPGRAGRTGRLMSPGGVMAFGGRLCGRAGRRLPAPLAPPACQNDRGFARETANRRNVYGKDSKAHGDHPESKDRQEPDHAARDQKPTYRDARRPRLGQVLAAEQSFEAGL